MPVKLTAFQRVRNRDLMSFDERPTAPAAIIRQEKGCYLAQHVKITRTEKGWIVPSQSGNGTYTVITNGREVTCTCPDYELHRGKCKHAWAVHFIIAGTKTTQDVPLPKKPSMPQDWPNYDMAKTNEATLFCDLIVDLALVTQELKPYTTGRRGYFPWEKIVCMAVKSYFKADMRKTESILKQLALARIIPRVPDFTTICTFYNDELLTPVLEDLIKVSARPLGQLETVGSMDATGYSTRRYKSWQEFKYGRQGGKERIWMKLHAAIGTRTNVFISAKVTEQDVGDNPMLKPVLGNVTRYFNMSEFTADRGYSSRETLQYLHDLGLTPYIPFRSNATGKSRGAMIWKTMFDHFQHHREDFDKHYHRRSNSESNFSALKARFGERLHTKNIRAGINDILIRVLCYNLTVLIQESFESGIHIDFAACRETTPPVEKAT